MLGKNILDAPEGEKKYPNSILSFWFFIVTLICYTITLVLIYYRRMYNIDFRPQPIITFISFISLICTISGFASAIKSMIKKDPWNHKKVIGFIGNFFFFSIFIFMLVTLLFDLQNYLTIPK